MEEQFPQFRASLDAKIIRAQQMVKKLIKFLPDNLMSRLQARSNRLNEIDDDSAELNTHFEFISKNLTSSKSSKDRVFLEKHWTFQLRCLISKIEKLETEVDELIKELEVLQTEYVDTTTTKSLDVVKINEPSIIRPQVIEYQQPEKKGSMIIPLFVGLICWFIWRNHDFSQAVMVADKPVVFRLIDASSWWAAILAGFTGFVASIFVQSLFNSRKRGD